MLQFDFPDMVEEAGGLWAPPKSQLISPGALDLPPYLSQLQHGSSRRRALPEDIVAIPLASILRWDRRHRCFIPYHSPAKLREAFHLSPEAKVVVTSVGKDQPLEDFWEVHVVRDLLHQLAALRLHAMTVPNFSFMLDVPRINSLVNLSRMFRVAERMTEAGIPTILHLQASTRFDWARLADVLKDQPKSHYVALEFQTGASRKEVGDRYYFGLKGLQEALGRQLHPVMLAGGGRIRDLRKDFSTFTVVDSIPFMKTMKRQTLRSCPAAGWRWHNQPSLEGEFLDVRLANNIRNYRRRMLERVGLGTVWRSGCDLFSYVA